MCLYSAVERTVVGWEHAVAYIEYALVPWWLEASRAVFRSGDQHVAAEGTMKLCFSIPGHGSMTVHNRVVRADVPILVGLDALRNFGLMLDFKSNCRRSTKPPWNIPFTYTPVHSFVSPSAFCTYKHDASPTDPIRAHGELEVRYTAADLYHFHLHFYHTCSQRQFALLRCADPMRASTSFRENIKRITIACEYFRLFFSTPFRFRSSVPSDELLFSQEIVIDLVCLERRPVLHMLYTHRRFRSGAVFRSKSSEDVWTALLQFWCTLYAGYPRVMRVEQESANSSDTLPTLTADCGIILQFSGV